MCIIYFRARVRCSRLSMASFAARLLDHMSCIKVTQIYFRQRAQHDMRMYLNADQLHDMLCSNSPMPISLTHVACCTACSIWALFLLHHAMPHTHTYTCAHTHTHAIPLTYVCARACESERERVSMSVCGTISSFGRISTIHCIEQ